MSMSGAFNIFISYSHQDAALKDRLLEHLASLSREGWIHLWHDRQIDPGEAWAGKIDNELERASVVLLMISPGFMASNYCYGVELARALERAACGEARVIPIIVRPTDWKHSKFGALQALPADGRPVTSWPDPDDALLAVATGLRKVLMGLHPDPQYANTLPAIPAPPSQARYYLYISDSKLEMLYPQVPPKLREQTASELGRPLDRESISPATLSDGERILRLETVLRHLEQCGLTGSVQAPKEYIAGKLDLQWGFLHRAMRPSVNEPPLIFFAGQSADTTLLMCGSTHHMIGGGRPQSSGFSSSFLPHVIESLMSQIELNDRPISQLEVSDRAATHTHGQLSYRGNELALALVEQARRHMGGVTQTLEFGARTLIRGTSPGFAVDCVLASPLYVALSF